VIGRVLALPAGTILMLTSAGEPHGWPHGAARHVLTWCVYLYIGANACWIISERRLMAGLTARAAGRQGQSA
jgi:hypothetical protein